MRSAEEQRAWELQAYGMTKDNVEEYYEDGMKKLSRSLRETTDPQAMLLVSELSDAQALIEMGYSDKARQKINVVKYLIMEKVGREKHETR